jgi:hypothetical protein
MYFLMLIPVAESKPAGGQVTAAIAAVANSSRTEQTHLKAMVAAEVPPNQSAKAIRVHCAASALNKRPRTPCH